MVLLGWQGPGQVREMGLERAHAPELTAPAQTPTKEPMKLFGCKVCERKFRKAMIMARHFNTSHADLKKDAETWREFVQEYEVTE